MHTTTFSGVGGKQKKSFLPLENGLSKQQSTRKNGSSINFHSVTPLPDGGYIIMKEEEKVQQLSDLCVLSLKGSPASEV